QRFHELQETGAVGGGGGEPLVAGLRQGLVAFGQLVFQRSEHEGERRTKLVAHVREERGLREIDLCESLRASPLVFVRESVRHRGGDPRGEQIVEYAVRVVQRRSRAHSRDQDRQRTLVARGS